MAARQGPSVFSMEREKKGRDRGWEGLRRGEQPEVRWLGGGLCCVGGAGRRQGQEAGPEREASNYSNSA